MIRDMPLLFGLLAGFSIAVPIGPMGLLCIQRTLASGMRVGVCTGLGAATVNVIFGAVVLLGLEWMPLWMSGDQKILSTAGGLYLLWSAGRTLMRRRMFGDQLQDRRQSPLSAYLSAMAFNATNPMALMLILALLSPSADGSAGGTAALLLGMFTAATSWWICLSGGVSLLRTRLRPELLLYVNQAAGMFLTIYGTLVLARVHGL
jgi:threonine/homoserine/homoserine lactone efflux protein